MIVDLPVKGQSLETGLPLLLHLLKKKNINVLEIRVFPLVEAFSLYVDRGKQMDMRLVEAFVEVISLLLARKSKMLLSPGTEEEPMVEEEREEAIERRERLKGMVEALLSLPRLGDGFFLRGGLRLEEKQNVLVLSHAFRELMMRKERHIRLHEIRPTIAEKIELIKIKLRQTGFFLWPEKAKDRLENITTFLAILELARLKVASILQRRAFGKIFVRRREVV